MKSVDYGAAHAKCLVVLLPGRGDTAETFRERGFVESLLNSGADLEVIAADATLGYYAAGIISERLEADVIAPVRGDQKVWLVGVSMGGLGVFDYARRHPGQVEGVIALAPFLGPASLAEEIRAAGGLRAWKSSGLGDEDYRELWAWLRDATASGAPEISLGYGEADRLAKEDSVLAEVLPADHVSRAPGGHEWKVWKPLFGKLLATSRLASSCRR
jgi:pimeloyl-ACP methyl ester carboxylesterase